MKSGEHQASIAVGSSQPTQPYNRADRAWESVNNGSFAVILCFAMVVAYGSRQIGRLVKSPTWLAMINTINQVMINQEKIEGISEDSKEIIELINKLHTKILAVGKLTHHQHRELIKEIEQLRKEIEKKDV